MPRAAHDLLIREASGREVKLRLAKDENGLPLWSSETLKFLPDSQPRRAAYGALIPDIGDVYGPFDLSDGIGQKFEVAEEHPSGKRAWYAKYMATEIAGEIRKGPHLATLAIAGDVAGLDGSFELAGVPYLVLGKTIASWASDTLTQKYTDSNTMSGGDTFVKVGNEASLESHSGDTTDQTFDTPDEWGAQQFRHSAAGPRRISKVVVKLDAATTNAAGDVRLRIYTDLNGSPGEELVSGRRLYETIGTTAVEVTFTFEDDGLVLEPDAPYWLVLDMASAGATNNIIWRRDATSGYARGAAKVSTDGGATWSAASGDFYFAVHGRTFTETAFVGRGTAATFLTSTDGATFTADSYRKASRFRVIEDRLVADVAGSGYVVWSTDGANWSEPILLGDPDEPVTELYNLNGLLVAAKEGSVWVVDIAAVAIGEIPDMQQVFGGGEVATNGRGGCFWQGVVYLPFAGRMLGIEGDLTNGVTVHQNKGPEALEDSASALGLTALRALAGDRFALWAFVQGTDGIEVFKSFEPLEKKWHGSQHTITTLAAGSDCKMAVVHDPGGSSSPHLFVQHTIDTTTDTAAKVGRITLPRTRNPGADTSYLTDIASEGKLYFPYSTGGFPVHPKGWTQEATTFLETSDGDYVRWMFDTLDGQGFRRFGPRLYDTDRVAYPEGLVSRLLGRVLLLTTTSTSGSPTILGSGVGYTVLPLGDLRDVRCTVLAEDGLADVDLDGAGLRRYLASLPSRGTFALQDHEGNEYSRVRFVTAKDQITSLGDRQHGARSVVSLRAVGEFVPKEAA